MDDEPVRRDTEQIILGGEMLDALRQVGVLPADMYTSAEGIRIEITRKQAVLAHIAVAVPLDRFQKALEIVIAERAKVQKAFEEARAQRAADGELTSAIKR